MPRYTRRQLAIMEARQSVRRCAMIYALVDSSSDDDSSTDGDMAAFALARAVIKLRELESQRYLVRDLYRSQFRGNGRFADDLNEIGEPGSQPWLNADEFRRKYRMSRDAFQSLHDLIKDDPVFRNNNSCGRKQRPVAHQLLTTLKALGGKGTASSAPDLCNTFGIGKGTSRVYIRRVIQAIRNHRADYINWPGVPERKAISRRIEDISGLPNCVGIVDGTLFPLAFRPMRTDASDYIGRKNAYAITAIIVCDDNSFIRYCNAGWPGSTHDNRVANSSEMWLHPEQYFQAHQYLVGDSAFENRWFMVSAFTSAAGEQMDPDRASFNTHLSKIRVVSEHTIGVLKGRFPWLRSIRNLVSEDKKTLHEILCWIDVCCILHNFLLMHTNPDIEEAWLNDDDVSDIEDVDRLPEDDELNQAIPDGRPGDYRRTQLMCHLKEPK